MSLGRGFGGPQGGMGWGRGVLTANGCSKHRGHPDGLCRHQHLILLELVLQGRGVLTTPGFRGGS